MTTQINIINRAADLVMKGMNPDFALIQAIKDEQLFIREMMERSTERSKEVYNQILNSVYAAI